MPQNTCVDMPAAEPGRMLAALRRARYGDLLALHLLLRCADGRHPPEIAMVLFCSRSRVYRAVCAYRKGPLAREPDDHGRLTPPVRTTVLVPPLRRSLLVLLKAPPRAYGWCRTRWSWATLALTRQATREITVSAETRRRWRHELGWGWKRATRVATDVDPQRVDRLARIRFVCEPLKHDEAVGFADELAIPRWPNVGGAGMPKGTQVAVMTPGQHATHDVAGALEPTTGPLHDTLGPRTTQGRFRDRLGTLEDRDPAARYTRLSGVVDHDNIHPATAVGPWVDAHPRVPLRWLPTYGPRANPLERAFGDVHDCCTRTHQRQHVPALVAAVEDQLRLNGPWHYKRSERYDEPAVTAAVENIAAVEHA